jgi:hypothetical protein
MHYVALLDAVVEAGFVFEGISAVLLTVVRREWREAFNTDLMKSYCCSNAQKILSVSNQNKSVDVPKIW